MSSSLILNNCLFCGFALLTLIPLLRYPSMLTYKKGIPLFAVILIIFLKLLVPYEFFFTQAIASKNILPAVTFVENLSFSNGITVGDIFLVVWFVVAAFILAHIFVKHCKLMRILSMVQETEGGELSQLLSDLCVKNHITRRPKLIQLDTGSSPFIVGYRNPIIVFPCVEMSKIESKFVLMHELQHMKHGHVFIKLCIEIVSAIYWWNPVMWILCREIIRSMEIQSDAYVLQDLSHGDRFLYLETLLNLSRTMARKQISPLAFCFSLKTNMLQRRVKTALKFDLFHKDLKINKLQFCVLMMAIVLSLASFLYIFEPYQIKQANAEGTFTVDTESDHWILREDHVYELYIGGKCVATMPEIPEVFSHLPIRK